MAHGEDRPAGAAQAVENTAKRDLTSWWRNFKKGGAARKEDEKVEPTDTHGIFGVPLQTSVRYANVAISLSDANGQSYIYGYVPIVVAKCGVFLKEKATDVEGIFRLSGSEKRIKELRAAFNSPDRYGKGLDWTGYTVHDAANILRRYFNQLPEPIIPLEFYQRFRDPIRNHQSQAVGQIDGQSPSVGDFDGDSAIRTYQQLITELPPLNRQLLLYILDLLAVFASKSDLNKMTTPNLAAIFQPGILSHPQHDMSPHEYRLSQDVLIFLIENQDHFLIGMPGTAADDKTVQEVESGPPTPQNQNRSTTPRHTKSTIVRSGSNSSKYSGVRRSVSASSKRSRNSVTGSPVVSDYQTPVGSPVTSSGVHRSNTLPPARSPNLSVGRFPREAHSGKSTPEAAIKEEPSSPTGPAGPPEEELPKEPPKERKPSQFSERKLHSQPLMQEMMTPTGDEMPSMPSLPKSTPLESKAEGFKSGSEEGSGINRTQAEGLTITTPDSLLPPSGQETPTSASKLAGLFGRSPPSHEGRKPNKLQKKPKSSSRNPSAHSSTQSLNGNAEAEVSQVSVPNSTASNVPLITSQKGVRGIPPALDEGELKPPPTIGVNHPSMSPAASFQSQSDMEHPDSLVLQSEASDVQSDGGRKRSWFSKKLEGDKNHPKESSLGTNDPAQRSRSSVLSGGENRKSVNLDQSQQGDFSGTNVMSDSEDGKKNPIKWFKGKLQERAERKEERDRLREEKRLASPTRAEHQSPSMNSLSSPKQQPAQPQSAVEQPRQSRLGRSIDLVRGKSMDVPRLPPNPAPPRPSHDVTRTDSVAPSAGPTQAQPAQSVPGAAPNQSQGLVPDPVPVPTPVQEPLKAPAPAPVPTPAKDDAPKPAPKLESPQKLVQAESTSTTGPTAP